jgi:hypothetical protein
MKVSNEISKYMFDLVGVEIKWDSGHTKPATEYTLFYVQGNENHEVCTGFLYLRETLQQLKG